MCAGEREERKLKAKMQKEHELLLKQTVIIPLTQETVRHPTCFRSAYMTYHMTAGWQF